MTHRRSSALLVLLVAALGLAGCVATPAPTPTPSASPPATPSETPSAEPTTEPSAVPAASCDTVLTADGYAKLANDGLEPIEPLPADHVATYYPLAAQMVEAGGLACDWGRPQTDIRFTVAQLPDADWGVWEPALAEAGFVETNDPVPGAYTGTVDPGTGIPPVVVVTGDTLTFVSAPTFAAWIASTS
jgi:hypothetical protein